MSLCSLSRWSSNLLLTDSDWSRSNTPSNDTEVSFIPTVVNVELLMISSERVFALAELIRGLLKNTNLLRVSLNMSEFVISDTSLSPMEQLQRCKCSNDLLLASRLHKDEMHSCVSWVLCIVRNVTILLCNKAENRSHITSGDDLTILMVRWLFCNTDNTSWHCTEDGVISSTPSSYHLTGDCSFTG